jgi:hypothetical protein
MKKILQINYKYNRTRPEQEKASLQSAQPIAKVKGIVWKVWIVNEAEKIAGGIYLFEDEASAEAYLKGPIIAAIKSMPVISDFEAKIFDIIPEPTKITHGPVD